MIAGKDRSVDHYPLTIEGAPAEVDAGAEFAITCRVAPPPGSDPSGFGVSIRDRENAELAFAELSRSGGETYATDVILLKAPLSVGEHRFRAVVIVQEGDGTAYDASSTEVAFVVKAHAIRLNVWDLPTAIVAGESFTLKAGIKCSAGCKLASRKLEIFDAEGNKIGAGKLRDEVWPGTSALYFAEVECKAPFVLGNHKWEVRFAAPDSGVPHAAASLAFDVKVVDPPECEVTVEAVDADSRTPIGGARVVMHPYRALSGANGVAKLNVVKGNYKLLVSASKYLAKTRAVEVPENITIRAELTLEPVIDPASYYV